MAFKNDKVPAGGGAFFLGRSSDTDTAAGGGMLGPITRFFFGGGGMADSGVSSLSNAHWVSGAFLTSGGVRFRAGGGSMASLPLVLLSLSSTTP